MEGKEVAVLSIGTVINNVLDAIQENNIQDVAVYDLRFIKPLDEALLHTIFKTHKTILTIEDGVKSGGFGSAVLEFAASHQYKNDIFTLGIQDQFPEQGTVEELQNLFGLSPKKIADFIFTLQ